MEVSGEILAVVVVSVLVLVVLGVLTIYEKNLRRKLVYDIILSTAACATVLWRLSCLIHLLRVEDYRMIWRHFGFGDLCFIGLAIALLTEVKITWGKLQQS